VNFYGTYLRRIRVVSGVSLRELAALLGVDDRYLGEVERGVVTVLPRRYWRALLAALPNFDETVLQEWWRDSRSQLFAMRRKRA
jgi:transcriptional regulator with XRE-family HTH domain